eukprot:8502251-Lingulodinium_polyedra.AAC.1
MRSASRGGGGRSIRPRRCAAFSKRCAAMRSNQPSAGLAARESQARVSCERQFRWPHGVRARDLGAVVA